MKSIMIEELYQSGVIAIIRGISEEKIGETVQALYDGEVRAVEIALNTSGALRMIEKVKADFGGKMCVGAGTVLDTESARAAILAGADFLLSPTLSVRVIEICNRYSKLMVPGVLTPTEILTAWEAGARLLKVFPAGTFGPQYFKDVKGPLPQVELMPVGGVSLENAGCFIRSGAHSLGVGNQLVNPSLVQQGLFQEITKRAGEFVGHVREARISCDS